uniref:Putative secreted protein n=1 Tax=Ixodes ricinus TaxID=34613 RepID=A0A6B0UIM3_IXORI
MVRTTKAAVFCILCYLIERYNAYESPLKVFAKPKDIKQLWSQVCIFYGWTIPALFCSTIKQVTASPGTSRNLSMVEQHQRFAHGYHVYARNQNFGTLIFNSATLM